MGSYTNVSGTVQYWRERPPSSYSLKIETYKELEKSKYAEKFESRPFTVGGHNWTLVLYPRGNVNENGIEYISLYVAIDNSSFIAAPSEVYADLKFVIYNEKEDKYWTTHYTEVRCFNMLRTVWGFSQVLPLNTFIEPKNGYLYDGDHCEFGVDVSVVPLFNKCEIFSITKKFWKPKFTCLFWNFSTLGNTSHLSDVFSMGGRNWALKLYPRGDGVGDGNSLSLYMQLGSSETLKPGKKIDRCKLRVIDQNGSDHVESLVDKWFDKPSQCWGFQQFISLADLRDTSKGFIVNDTLKMEVKFETVSGTEYLPN